MAKTQITMGSGLNHCPVACSGTRGQKQRSSFHRRRALSCPSSQLDIAPLDATSSPSPVLHFPLPRRALPSTLAQVKLMEKSPSQETILHYSLSATIFFNFFNRCNILQHTLSILAVTLYLVSCFIDIWEKIQPYN